MGRGFQLAFFLLALTVVSAAQSNPGAPQEFHHTYAVDRNQPILIRNFYGNMRLSGWDRPEIKVDAVAKSNRNRSLDLIVTSKSDGFCLATRYGEERHSLRNWFGFASDPCRDQRRIDVGAGDVPNVEYTISVPRNATVTLLVNQGDVDVEGLTGKTYIDIFERGHLNARDVAGDCKLFGSFSGVNVTLSKLARDTQLTTAVGPLVVYLAPELSARVHAHANSGAVFNEFGWPRKPHEDLQAQLGNPGPLLDLTNFNGRIDIRRLPPPTRAKAQVPKAH